MSFPTLSTHAKGTLLTVFAVLVLTPDSLLVRKLSHLPNFVVMFYRYLVFTVVLTLFLGLTSGPKGFLLKFKSIGKIGWFAGLIWGASNLLITYGFQTIAAATVLVIIASNPMFSALFSYLILKETVPWHTFAAGLVCFGAIVSIFYSQLSGDESTNVAGLLSSLGAAATMGLYFVLLRLADIHSTSGSIDSMPCNIIAGVFACVVSLLVDSDQVVTQNIDWLYIVINGTLVLALAFSLLNICPTMISAPEVSLITLIETVLGPVWVYLGGYESPPITAVYGGCALIAALAIHSVVALYYEKSPAPDGPISGADSDLKTLEDESTAYGDVELANSSPSSSSRLNVLNPL